MSVWKRLRGKLATSFRTELHQVALPLLRIRWPDMRLCRDLEHLDKCGIDLVAPGNEDVFSCVVQCKGFDGHGPLDETHLKQILKSIDTFEESEYCAETYVLLHTKDARGHAIEALVRLRLDHLVKAGRIKQHFVWNRQTFVDDCAAELAQQLVQRMNADARDQLDSQSRFFRFAGVRISPVQARHQTWRIRPTPGQDSMGTAIAIDVDASNLRQRAHKMRFSCLLGSFGSGKTTLALQAAAVEGHEHWHLIYVPARYIDEILPSQGASLVYRQMVRAGNLLRHLPDDDATTLEPYAADTVRSLLQNPDQQIVLCIDGLDESPALGDTASMVTLANALGEMRCPILLTTRREHFDATFGNFALMVNQLSAKGGFNRDAHIYELLEWSDINVQRLIERARNAAEPEERPGLEHLMADLNSGVLARDLAGLYRHPLFLQMLLDASARSANGVDTYHRLIPIWARGKIVRDLSVGRRSATLSTDAFATIGAIFRWMEGVATLLMRTDVTPGVMLDDMEVSTLLNLAAGDPLLAAFSETDLLTTSLLIPTNQRSLRPLRARFFHRVFQEYFTARACVRAGTPQSMLPRTVQRWSEMARADIDE